jgi:hypothetical protein
MMSSPHILTLFAEPEFPTRSSSLLASFLVHGAGGFAISVGMLRNPPVLQASLHSFYPIRLVNLAAPVDPENSSHPYTAPIPWSSPQLDQGRDAQAETAGNSSARRHMHRAQLLLQADTSVLQIQDEVAPSLMIVAVKPVNITPIEEPSRRDVASAAVRPKLDLPNGESRPADLNVTSSRSVTENSAILPSSSTPIAIVGSSDQMLPGRLSESNSQAAFARILSISDQQLASGSVVLPEVSIVPSALSFGNGQEGRSSTAQGGRAPAEGGSQGAGIGGESNISVKRIILPQNGHFSVVLIGDSIEDAYPETAGTWRGRLAYTVYLPIDAGKRWILQYSLSCSSQPTGTMSAARPEAPWPVDMRVPNLDAYLAGIGAVIVRGVITQEGHFGDLAVAFPPQFPQEGVLVDSLRKWTFRPALRKGRPVELEILLIIPGTE